MGGDLPETRWAMSPVGQQRRWNDPMVRGSIPRRPTRTRAAQQASPSRLKPVALLGVVEADDGPNVLGAAASYALHTVVAVLQNQSAILIRRDHRRGLPPVLHLLLEIVDVVAPVVVIDRAENRFTGRPGQAMQLRQRNLDGAEPPPESGRELVGQHGVVTARAREELGDPRPQRVVCAGGTRSIERKPVVIRHAASLPTWPRGVTRRVGSRVSCGAREKVTQLVERVQCPPLALALPLPLGEARVPRLDPRAVPRPSGSEQDAHRGDDHAAVAHGDDRPAGVLLREPFENLLHALVEAVPALSLRREHAVRFRLHVERSIANAPFGPLQAVRLAGMDLAQIALTPEGLDPEPGSDDLRRLDGPRDDARQQDVGPHPARHREVVAERRGLVPAEIGQARAAARPTDDPMEARVRVSVTNEYQSHGLFTVWACSRRLRQPIF